MTGLPEDVRELLAAVVDGLTVPLAGTSADDKVRAVLLDRRASDVLVIVEAVLKGDDVARSAKHLREWTAQQPVTYTPYAPPAERGDGS